MKTRIFVLATFLFLACGCVNQNAPQMAPATSVSVEATATTAYSTTTSTTTTTTTSTSTTVQAPEEVRELGLIYGSAQDGYTLAYSVDSTDPSTGKSSAQSDTKSLDYSISVIANYNADKKQAIISNRGSSPVYDVVLAAPMKANKLLGKYIYADFIPKIDAGQEITVSLRQIPAGYNLSGDLIKQGFTDKEAGKFLEDFEASLPDPWSGNGSIIYKIDQGEYGKIFPDQTGERTAEAVYASVTLTGKDNPAPPVMGTGFGIYVGQNPVITEDDIVSYDPATHEIKLSDVGLMKMRSQITYDEENGKLVPSLGGLYLKTFTVRLNGQELYGGTFMTKQAPSSETDNGIVLLDVLSIESDDHLTLQAGYPSKDYFKGADPRNNAQLMEYLKQKGKLIG